MIPFLIALSLFTAAFVALGVDYEIRRDNEQHPAVSMPHREAP